MLFWDTRIEDAELRPRLEKLGLRKATVYAMGCVTHARDRLLKHASVQVGHSVQTVSRLIAEFWDEYPQSLQTSVIGRLAGAAADLTPEEGDGSFRPGEEPIIWGAAYAFSLATRSEYSKDAVSEALSAVDQAYWAVFSFFHEQDHICRGDEEISEVEKKSAICLAEIEFQLAFLSVLEAVHGQPPPYAALLQQMSSGD